MFALLIKQQNIQKEEEEMKNITLRKIVLYSIALLSAIMLLVGLSFDVGYLSYMGEKEGFSGFESLAFELPTLLRSLIILATEDVAFLELYEVFFGITSLLTLIASVLFMGLIILAFFKFDKKKGERALKIFLAISVIIAVVHSIFPIIFSADLNNCIEDLAGRYDDSLRDMKVGTVTFVSLIIQVVILIGYIVCSKVIKEKEKQVVETSVAIKEEGKTKVSFEADLSFEYSTIELLKEYKSLHSENIITDAEYMDKRVKLTNSANEKIKQISSALNKADFENLLKIEKTAIQILREYKKLLESQIISDSDYIAKKVTLLSCVIK